MKKERILSTAVFLVSISAGAMANNAIPNQEGAAIAKQLTEKGLSGRLVGAMHKSLKV